MIGPQWPSTPEEFEKLAYDLDWEILKVKEEMLETKRQHVFYWREHPPGSINYKLYEANLKLKEEAFEFKIKILELRKEKALLKAEQICDSEYIALLELNQAEQ